MEDLSRLLAGDPVTALAPTSQAGGNMMSDNKLAMTAPGSQPVDPLPPAKEQADPKISTSNSRQIPPGTPPERLHGGRAQPPDWSTHADGESGAGTYDEPSFGQARSGFGPWKQT